MTLFRLLCLRVMKGVSATASYQLSDATLLKVRGSGTLVTATMQFYHWGLHTNGKSYQTPTRKMDGPGIVTTDKLNTCTPSSTYF